MITCDGIASWLALRELQLISRHHAPKQCICMHILYLHIDNLPLQLRAISIKEHGLILAVSPNSTIPVLWVRPLHKHLPSDAQQGQSLSDPH